MELDKREILLEQVKEQEKDINVYIANFNEEDIADEVNFLHIVKQNLEEWSNKS